MIPTAEELINKIDNEFYEKNSYYLSISNPELFAKTIAIEFAKLHVEAALKAVIEKAEMSDIDRPKDYYEEDGNAISKILNKNIFACEGYYHVALNDESVYESYPLTLIK